MQITETKGVPIKHWTEGVPVEYDAWTQLRNTAELSIVKHHVAVMPDVHIGRGATVGSVIPTYKAIIPAAVGVDIGCGMIAVKTTIKADQLPDSLKLIRESIENVVPCGEGLRNEFRPRSIVRMWSENFKIDYEYLIDKYPGIESAKHPAYQLGTLGGGNHFIEICLDEKQNIWIMLHSGSRNTGNRIGTEFIIQAQKWCISQGIGLKDQNLAYLVEESPIFNDYVKAVDYAQRYAFYNRQVMLEHVIEVFKEAIINFNVTEQAIQCHHNYVQKEIHFGDEVWLTRKGAVSAKYDELGIIPGSMGAKSFIVRGLGNIDSFHTCSHGAGRRYSRSKAKELFTLEDHKRTTEGVECRKDRSVLDETPQAYKDIDQVMEAQKDLVEIVHTLKQVLCVKG